MSPEFLNETIFFILRIKYSTIHNSLLTKLFIGKKFKLISTSNYTLEDRGLRLHYRSKHEVFHRSRLKLNS